MSKLRQTLLSAAPRPRELVTLTTETGEKIPVLIIGMSQGVRSEIMKAAIAVDEEGERSIDFSTVMPDIVIAVTHDPETEQPVFSKEDRDAVAASAADFYDPAFEAGTRLSGMTDKATKALAGKSEATLTDSSSSTSSASSAE